MSVHFQDAQKPLRSDPAAIEKAIRVKHQDTV